MAARRKLALMEGRPLRSVLVVDDDQALVRSVCTALEESYETVRSCLDTTSALTLLDQWTPDLLILDVALTDGSAFDVLDVATRRGPLPLVVAISGQATPDQSFRLARLGVHTYLSKPFSMKALREGIEAARREPLDLRSLVRDTVGRRSLREVVDEIRGTMLDEAMARARGNRRIAARFLDVSRQVIQHMLRLRRS